MRRSISCDAALSLGAAAFFVDFLALVVCFFGRGRGRGLGIYGASTLEITLLLLSLRRAVIFDNPRAAFATDTGGARVVIRPRR
jgi:hypothetical protein